MTTGSPAALRTFAFGDLDTGLWGVAVASETACGASFADPLGVHAGGIEEQWTLSGAGVELEFTPTTGAAGLHPASAGVDGFVQLCRVEGGLHRDGSEHDIACFGARATIALPSATTSSARAAAAWFGPADGFALVALRPARAKGHDADALACALFEDGESPSVEEPRFSTTYTSSGIPRRAGLELWLAAEDGDEGEAEDTGAHEEGGDRRVYYPRRVAGETVGDGARFDVGGLAARAELFRWHGRGREGAGVYVLVPSP
jgi:hypothetical protein